MNGNIDSAEIAECHFTLLLPLAWGFRATSEKQVDKEAETVHVSEGVGFRLL